MSLLDQIGPVMVGPSSSHTAGACRLALLARHVLGAQPRQARFVLHGSFAKTAQGHGTDLALVAGLLGYLPDDERIRDSFTHAAAAGLEFEFATADLGDIHPNSVRMELSGGPDDEGVSVLGSSLGAGFVKIVQVNGFDVQVSGAYHTILALHTDRPGVIARVASVVADDDGNIATAFSARQRRGGHAMMSVEIDRPLAEYAVTYLTQLPYIHWLRTLPAVMATDPAPQGGEAQ
ncbi:MAG TPA: L-serine ammonia-lyase, iron-sulfur-dependent subunit beta [Trueperaceae bacterium]|nr:L-serine ammonia-lyase, iron-sulfur-dependent subunit beta [Trueperaceae bacterium]HRP46140.1 L-serine ammonia-lyase, iron-sulfur-dependent subunit beta [Trueperaceae bacterium]